MNILLGLLVVVFVVVPAIVFVVLPLLLWMLQASDLRERRRYDREGDGVPRKRHWRDP